MAGRDLVSGQGCAPDGTQSARNPLGALVDGILRAPRQDHMAPMPGGPMGPGDAQLAEIQAAMRDGAQHPMQPGPHPGPQHHPGMHPGMQAAWNVAGDHPSDQEHLYAQNLARAQANVSSEAAWEASGAAEAAWREAQAAGAAEAAWREAGMAQEAAWREAGQRDRDRDPDPEAMRHTASHLVHTMAANPKFENSSFLQFMRDLSQGQTHLQGNQVAMGPGGPMQQAWGQAGGPQGPQGPQMEQAWGQAGPGPQMNQAWAQAAEMHAAWQASQGGPPPQHMQQAWAAAGMPPPAQMDQAWAAAAHQQEAEAAAATAAAQAQAPFEDAWAEVGEVQLDHADPESEEAKAAMQQTLEDAWEESQSDEQMGKLWDSLLAAQGSEYQRAWTASQAQDGEEADLHYEFKGDNPFAEHPAPFDEGVRLFDAGLLNEAVLAFEAELQRNPDHSEAWRLLGASHAENDADRPAIVCLERAVEADPCNLQALAALGVSYVNELDYQRALKNLRAWVEANPKFQGLEVEQDAYSDGSLMDDVLQLMTKAAQFDGEDADVQIVLGVLFNVSRDFDSAIAAFQAATRGRPDDYSCWNKLGATLANGSRPAEALPAYDRALALKPKYARGWLNRGISFANLGNYDQAARCYLQALSLSPGAAHIWSYLRIAFSCLERFDLVNLAQHRDVALFAEEFPLQVPQS